MRLTRLRIKDFRSIKDSGWVEIQNVTAFVGENESGKTNIFMALLKLVDTRKAGDFASPSLKAPSATLSRINLQKDLPIERAEELLPKIAEIKFISAEFELTDEINSNLCEYCKTYKPVSRVMISKTYAGEYDIDIIEKFPDKVKNKVKDYIINMIPRFIYYREVVEIDSKIDLLSLALKLSHKLRINELTAKERMFSNLLRCLDIWESNLINSITTVYEKLISGKTNVDFNVIFEKIPLFLNRVKRGFDVLNREFAKWWGKDDITIGFEPYDRGIVIVISDSNGKKFLLENRSTGFRRFFALFLSFSVTKTSDYANSILLFDEAGSALHSLTQRKLLAFFNNLGKTTQILYNTHTPYMISVSDLNRMRVIYKDEQNHTQISSSLKINESRNNELALFPVQTSLALFVAERALAGCLPIIVLNEYDQYYLSLIKSMLAAKKELTTVYETLVFATGENGIDAATEAFSDGNDLPVVLLPSTETGKQIKARLIKTRYKDAPKKILEIADFDPEAKKFEDLIPSNFIEIFSRLYLAEILDKDFRYNKNEDLLIQIENYAAEKKIHLPENYRIEMAKRMKLNTMRYFRDVHIPLRFRHIWVKIWATLIAT